MDISPEMRELRDGLDRMGVPYEVGDEETEDEEGFVGHVEATTFRMDGEEAVAMVAWTRDADGRKRFESTGGRFGYLELTVGCLTRPVLAEEVLSEL